VERGGSGLQTLPAFDDPASAAASIGALRGLVEDGRLRELVIRKVDGLPVSDSPHRATLVATGFAPGYRGMILR
jgi:hypothetical protein